MKKNLSKIFLIISFMIVGINAAFAISAKDKKTVVATVGDKTFYLSDVKALHESNEQLKAIPLKILFKNIVDSLVNDYLVEQKAREMGLDKDSDVKEALKSAENLILRQIYAQKEVTSRLEKKGLKKLYKEYLKENPPQEEVHARHILVETEDEAKEIIKQLKDGANFADLAKEKSVGPSATVGGDLNYFKKEDMVPEFAEAAFSMNAGEFSKKPVKTQFGWHIIKVEDRRIPDAPSMKELEPTVKAYYAKEILSDIFNELRKDAKVKIIDVQLEE